MTQHKQKVPPQRLWTPQQRVLHLRLWNPHPPGVWPLPGVFWLHFLPHWYLSLQPQWMRIEVLCQINEEIQSYIDSLIKCITCSWTSFCDGNRQQTTHNQHSVLELIFNGFSLFSGVILQSGESKSIIGWNCFILSWNPLNCDDYINIFTNVFVLLWLPYWYVHVAFLLYTCMSIFYMWYLFLQTICFSDNLEITMYTSFSLYVWLLWSLGNGLLLVVKQENVSKISLYLQISSQRSLSLQVLTLKMLYIVLFIVCN